MYPDEFDREELETARRDVRRRLGSDLASKGTPAFCVAAHRHAVDSTAGWGAESVAPAGAPLAAVVEFAAPAELAPLPRFTERDDWQQISDAVARLDADGPDASSIRVPTVLRRVRSAALRNDCYRRIGAVYTEVERLSGSRFGPENGSLGTPQIPTQVTQVCWLNNTMRTFVGPEALADVVASDTVSAVDVPRRLMPDAVTRNHTAIRLPAFLAAGNGLTGKGVVVAVIDSEIATGHPALNGRVVQRRNYTLEAWGNPDRHGTAVAGIIGAADPDNPGVATEVMIYNYKVLATSRFLNGDDFGGSLALQQAVEDDVDVANCSWGAGPIGAELSREARAVDAAWALGMTVVKSAGNRGPGAGTMTTPADANGVIVVGGSDLDGMTVESYSSRGPNGGKKGPDVLAPGGNAAAFVNCCQVAGGFGDSGFGTSYAAPHVAGLVAHYLQQDPHLVPDQLRDRLLDHARTLTAFGAEAQGSGLIQAV